MVNKVDCIDAIVHDNSGVWSAFEIKFGRDKHDKEAKHLLKLAFIMDMKKVKPPSSRDLDLVIPCPME